VNFTVPTGGHRGVIKTYHRIKHNYYWENLKADIQRYISTMFTMSVEKISTCKNQAANDDH